jgi:quercetin dioxygenase-like cupin family protein
MRTPHARAALLLIPACAALASLGLTAAPGRVVEQPPPSQSRVALSRALPPMDGRDIRLRLVDVTYPPGGANAAHTHPCPVVGYVLQGALRMKVSDGPEVVYRAGETFFEGVGDVHQVSANASTTEPARFLAYFMCERDVAQLSIPVAPAGERGKRR